MFLKLPQILRSFSKKERLIFIASSLVFLIASLLVITSFIQNNTVLVPVDSGEYTEGIVGQPVFINPVLAGDNGTDSDISRLVFANLKNLIETYSSSDDHRIFTIRIKGDIFWQDNQPLTTDDIIFTIEAIQDPNTASPLYSNWKGVKVERTSERELKITLPSAYAYFQNIMQGLRPIPKHIFAAVPFAHMKLSNYNLEPIGSGAFQFDSYQQRKDGFITKISLKRNDLFPDAHPHLDRFSFMFYSNEKDMIQSFNSGSINGFALSDIKNRPQILIPDQLREIRMPRYYAIFIDIQNNPILSDPTVKAALNYATDKEKTVKTVFDNAASAIDAPILFSKDPVQANTPAEFSIDKANAILDSANWIKGDDGIRMIKDKLTTKRLEFTLTVYPAPFLVATAKILQADWANAGIKLNLNIPAPSDFNEGIIKTRNYELLLFGNIYGENLDPFSFWHSSQKFYPGLNLSLYENKTADSLIETIRTDFNPDKRQQELEALQSVIKGDQPAVFLYSPYYLYVSSKSLHGFDEKYLSLPSDRFSNIQNWYVRTVRILK